MTTSILRRLVFNFSKINLNGSSLNQTRSLLPVLRFSSQLAGRSNEFVSTTTKQEVVKDSSQNDDKITTDIIAKVNEQIRGDSTGRLFAVVHICGKQFKVTSNDLIIIEGTWPPDIGDEIKLDKVLCVGSTDFTLFGRPILDPNLVRVKATVIEKTLSHTKTHFRKKKRKQYMRINFYRIHHTMLRINWIEIADELRKSAGNKCVTDSIY